MRAYSPTALDQYADDLNRDGICVLEGVFDAALIKRWADAFEALVKERRGRPGGLAPRGPGRFYVSLPWTAPFADPDVFANPNVLGVLNRVFAQEYVMVQLAADTPERGSTYQDVHRDYRPLFADNVVTPLYALAVNFALCDVTADNGPFEMVRGTHVIPKEQGLRDVAEKRRPIEAFPMRAGDVMIRTPLALHRGTPNNTDQPRPMVVMGYVMHWLHTPKVDLTVPRAAYDQLPAELRALLRCQVVDQAPVDAVESYIDFEY